MPSYVHFGAGAFKGRVRLSGFGHIGMGGSIGLCDPASGLAFAMTTNKVHPPWILAIYVFVLAMDSILETAHSWEPPFDI